MGTLKSLGVSSTAEQIYRYLLRHPEADPTDTTAGTAVDRDVLDEALDQLEHCGLVRRDGRHVVVPDPAVAIERLIERRLEAATEEILAISAARRSIGSLVLERDADALESTTGLEHIRGLQQVRDRLEDLAFFTYREVLALHPDGALQPAAIAAARPLDLRCLRRGVSLRTIVSKDILQDPATLAYFTETAHLGASIRTVDQRVDRMLIYDREIALVPLDPGDSSRGALLVRQPGLVASMVALFEKIWSNSEDLPRSGASPDPNELLTETESQVLAVLGRTDKDETSAREMGVSVRTFRRHVADLMLRLGAANRFQLALLAEERGWI